MRHALLLLLAVAGCSSASSRAVFMSDKRWAYEVTCRDQVDCVVECNRLCPNGYDVFRTGDRDNGAVAMTVPAGNSTVAVATPLREGVIVLRCQPGPYVGGAADH